MSAKNWCHFWKSTWFLVGSDAVKWNYPCCEPRVTFYPGEKWWKYNKTTFLSFLYWQKARELKYLNIKSGERKNNIFKAVTCWAHSWYVVSLGPQHKPPPTWEIATIQSSKIIFSLISYCQTKLRKHSIYKWETLYYLQ